MLELVARAYGKRSRLIKFRKRSNLTKSEKNNQKATQSFKYVSLKIKLRKKKKVCTQRQS